MVRRYKKYRKYSNKAFKTMKYSSETYAAIATNYRLDLQNQVGIVFTTGTSVLGTRKAKNFTLTITTNSAIPFVFALVFVPEGTTPSSLNQGTEQVGSYLQSVSLYEPNQNVIMSGMFGGVSSQINRYKTRLARNLNSGDIIVLLIKALVPGEQGSSATVDAMLNYAISY